MIIYLCNRQFERVAVFENMHSMIWTERYRTAGDFQMEISIDAVGFNLITPDYYFEYEHAENHMLIESIRRIPRTRMAVIKGRCLKALLARRVNKMVASSDVPSRMEAVASCMMHSFTWNVTHTMPAYDRITDTAMGDNFLPWGGGPEGVRSYSSESVLDELTSIANTYNVGWRYQFYKKFTYANSSTTLNSHLIFSVYMGSFRGLGQSQFNNVVFAPELDNIIDAETLFSYENYRNVAFLKDPSVNGGFIYMPRPGEQDLQSQWWRRPVVVSMGGEDRSKYSADQWWTLRRSYAYPALAKHRKTDIIEGRFFSSGQFQYGRDYFMGDTVTLGLTNTQQKAQIIEHIWSLDPEEGETSYPTFEIVDEL